MTYINTNDKTLMKNNNRKVDISLIYLDYAATTPINDKVLEVYVEASQKYFGNPSSLHDIGSEANEVLSVCRQELAKLINGNKAGVYFTSSGSEANVLAIRSLIDEHKNKGRHLITTDVEHSSVYNLFKQLEDEGFGVTYLKVDAYGMINLEELKQAVNDDTIFVSIHHGNSEVGTVQNIEAIGQFLKEKNVIFHTDCVQTFGKIPIDSKQYHIDSLSVSSHKVYGPKGVGACYINPRLIWRSQYKGTTHEKGFKPGTVDVPGIVAFTSAAQFIIKNMEESEYKYKVLRKYLLEKLSQINHDIKVYGGESNQLQSIVGMRVSGIQGQYVMLECNRNGLAISTGSACQVGQQSPSRTMLSMGESEHDAKQFIRISLGESTEKEHMKKFTEVIQKTIEKI